MFQAHQAADTLLEAACLEAYAALCLETSRQDPELAISMLARKANELKCPLTCEDRGMLAYAYALTGNTAEASEWIAKALQTAETPAERAQVKFREYQVASRSGDTSSALAALEEVMDHINSVESVTLQRSVESARKEYKATGNLEYSETAYKTYKKEVDSLESKLNTAAKNAADQAKKAQEAKEKADIESIRIFGENLRQLLLAPPIGQKRVLAIDPGFRTGCKVVCLDEQGNLLHNEAIFPHPPANEKVKAIQAVSAMVMKYGIEVIAIGNGTASRETEEFIKRVPLPQGVRVFTVSEDGASIYSASEVARAEFPDHDVTVRGAVSIGRRLMDPLAELVKIDPKSLGVGQYQHDVDQGLLKETLDNTVESCVNNVGVNLNTASSYLLSYVSGIGPALAENIVEYRSEHGAYKSRKELLKVKRLGDKAFEQCAGFLRIHGAANPLDNSAVHPEAYHIVDKMARDLSVSAVELVGNAELCAKIDPSKYVEGDFGLPTINDIIAELRKPGLDPRETAETFEFDHDIKSIEDLKMGMELPGIVTNITAFGAFVDIGIKQNGLIHASQMGVKGMADPSKILKLHQHVKVTVVGDGLPVGIRGQFLPGYRRRRAPNRLHHSRQILKFSRLLPGSQEIIRQIPDAEGENRRQDQQQGIIPQRCPLFSLCIFFSP